MRHRFLLAVFPGACFLLMSCTGGAGKSPVADKVPLTLVSGKVSVDGVPTGGVILKYVPNGAIAETRQNFVRAFHVLSNQDGAFALKTYARGDGVPAGEYKLYCQYFPDEEQERRREVAEDRFGGKYFLPNKPAMTFTAKGDQPLDLGTIELKSAPKKRK